MSLLMDALKKAEKAKAANKTTPASVELPASQTVDGEKESSDFDLSLEEHVENHESGPEPDSTKESNSPYPSTPKSSRPEISRSSQPIPPEQKVSPGEKTEQPGILPPRIAPSQIDKPKLTYFLWSIGLALLLLATGMIYYLTTSEPFQRPVATPVTPYPMDSKHLEPTTEMQAKGVIEAVIPEEGNTENRKIVVPDAINKPTERAGRKTAVVTASPTPAPFRPEADKTVSQPLTPNQQAGQSKPVALDPSKRQKEKIHTSGSHSTQGQLLKINRSQTVSPIDRMLKNAYTAYQDGDVDQADRLYRQVLLRDKTNRDAMFGRAIIAQRQNRPERARSLYASLLKQNPKDSMALIGFMSLSKQGGGQNTISRLKMILQEEPTAAHVHFALGNEYAAQSRWPEAQHAYFEANRYAVDNAEYAYNLAVSLEHIGQSKAALKYYRTAMETVSGQSVGFDIEAVSKRIHALGNREGKR